MYATWRSDRRFHVLTNTSDKLCERAGAGPETIQSATSSTTSRPAEAIMGRRREPRAQPLAGNAGCCAFEAGVQSTSSAAQSQASRTRHRAKRCHEWHCRPKNRRRGRQRGRDEEETAGRSRGTTAQGEDRSRGEGEEVRRDARAYYGLLCACFARPCRVKRELERQGQPPIKAEDAREESEPEPADVLRRPVAGENGSNERRDAAVRSGRHG